MKKVVYHGFEGERKFAVDYLSNKYNWDPLVFVDSEIDENNNSSSGVSIMYYLRTHL